MTITTTKTIDNGSIKNRFLKKRTVSIIPAPFSGGQGKSGVDEGPLHLLNAGLREQIQDLGWAVDFEDKDLSTFKPADDPPIGVLKNSRFVANVTKHVSEAVQTKAKEGGLVLTLGGDHSLAIGTISGVMAQYPDACVIWVDAHADINTISSTESGNIHGCPVSFVMGLSDPLPSPFEWLTKCLDPSRIVYIGLRDIDPPEREIIRKHNIAAYTMHHVDKYGIGKVVEMALEKVNPNLDKPIHLSFDVDGMDPSVAPSTGTPVRGGLSWRESMYICEALHETGCLVAMDLMEVNPSLADPEAVLTTVTAGCALTRCALGETLL